MQADPLLAHHFIEKECDIVMCNDSDIFVHCPSEILMHGFKYNNGLGKIVLATASKEAAQQISNILVSGFEHFNSDTNANTHIPFQV